MADEPKKSGWVVEPPEPGQVVVHIAAGEGVELSDEQRGALDDLLASLQQADEVSGFARTCNVTSCKPKFISQPCAWYEGTCGEYSACQITEFGRFI